VHPSSAGDICDDEITVDVVGRTLRSDIRHMWRWGVRAHALRASY
jgi:hypothetical protein